MIVLVHQIYFLVESFLGWLNQPRKKNDDFTDRTVETGDLVDGQIPVIEEIIQSEVYSSSLLAERKLFPDDTDESFNFPFLRDQKTINHIKQSKVMFIMRGLPGSGKSSIVARISNAYRNLAVCSADSFFMRGGVYNWDQKLLSTAHNECQQKAKEQCEAGTPVVVIDNTNIKKWEMNRYLQFAFENSYPVVIVEPKTSWKNDPVRLAQLNSHSVTADIIEGKLKGFEQVLPWYFGWFLNEEQSEDLINIAKESLHHLATSFKDVIKEEAFLMNSKNNLHCTAMFMGGRNFPAPKRDTYPTSKVVQRSYGSVFDLRISRIAITSRTVGFQVKLSTDGLKLYERPELDKKEEELKAKYPGRNVYLERGCSAHITMGTIDGVTPKTTGDDLLEMIGLETEVALKGLNLQKFESEIGTVTMVTKDMFIIELKAAKQRTVRGLFSGYYGNGGGSPRRN